jgi:hypothetical protein
VKEALTNTAWTSAYVPGYPESLHLTREQFDMRIRPRIEAAVTETARVLDEARLAATDLDGILLVGGSAQVPLLATELLRRFKISPALAEHPQLAVAEGALRYVADHTHDLAEAEGSGESYVPLPVTETVVIDVAPAAPARAAQPPVADPLPHLPLHGHPDASPADQVMTLERDVPPAALKPDVTEPPVEAVLPPEVTTKDDDPVAVSPPVRSVRRRKFLLAGLGALAVAGGSGAAILLGKGDEKPTRDGRELARLETGWPWARSVALSPDGRTVAAACPDGIRLWSRDGNRVLRTLQVDHPSIESIAYNPQASGVLAGGGRGSVLAKVWDTETGSVLATLAGHAGDIMAVAFSPDGTTLATGGRDNMIRVWETRNYARVAVLEGHSRPVNTLAFSPDGRLLASGSDDISIKLWDLPTGGGVRTLVADSLLADSQPGPWTVRSVAFAPDGQTLASTNSELTVRQWNVGTGRVDRTLPGLYPAAFSPRAGILVSAGTGYELLLRRATGDTIAVLRGHTSHIHALTCGDGGAAVASSSADGTVRLWNVDSVT